MQAVCRATVRRPVQRRMAGEDGDGWIGGDLGWPLVATAISLNSR